MIDFWTNNIKLDEIRQLGDLSTMRVNTMDYGRYEHPEIVAIFVEEYRKTLP